MVSAANVQERPLQARHPVTGFKNRRQRSSCYPPSVLCGDPGPQGSRFRGSGGRLEAHGQGCLRCFSGQTQLPSPRELTRTIHTRGEGAAPWTGHRIGRGSKEGCSARPHLRGPESTGSCPASLLPEGPSWVSSQLDCILLAMGADCTSSVDEVPPRSDSSPLVSERLPRVSECRERRDPTFPYRIPKSGPARPPPSRWLLRPAMETSRPQGLEAEGLHALQVQL